MSSANFSINKLGALKGVLQNVEESELDTAAKVAEEYARDHVQVLTGQTQASIHTEINSSSSIDLIAAGASLFLEYGTVHMRAFPFMRPAMDAAEQVVVADHIKNTFESQVGGS